MGEPNISVHESAAAPPTESNLYTAKLSELEGPDSVFSPITQSQERS